jgi:hypothetical protein
MRVHMGLEGAVAFAEQNGNVVGAVVEIGRDQVRNAIPVKIAHCNTDVIVSRGIFLLSLEGTVPVAK